MRKSRRNAAELHLSPQFVMTDFLETSADAHALKCELASDVLRSSGTLRLQVTGWSMLPALWPGDTIHVERAGVDEVLTGDIVLFGRDQRLFVHRVVKVISDTRLSTQGDAMQAADPVVTRDEFLGRVSLVERNGKSFAPGRNVGIAARISAGLFRRSTFAARVFVGTRRFHALQLRMS